jgi:hypothetical protein
LTLQRDQPRVFRRLCGFPAGIAIARRAPALAGVFGLTEEMRPLK